MHTQSSINITEIDNGWLLSSYIYSENTGPMSNESVSRYFPSQEEMKAALPEFVADVLERSERAKKGLAEKDLAEKGLAEKAKD